MFIVNKLLNTLQVHKKKIKLYKVSYYYYYQFLHMITHLSTIFYICLSIVEQIFQHKTSLLTLTLSHLFLFFLVLQKISTTISKLTP